MKSSKLLLPVAVVGALMIGVPNVGALSEYYGRNWSPADLTSERIQLYPIEGVQMNATGEGSLEISTTVPADTSTWDEQHSGEGSTGSYIYVGLTIEPVEGAVALNSTCDAQNNGLARTELTNKPGEVQCWYPVANRENGVYSLFGSGRVYDALFEWLDEDGEAISREAISSIRNIKSSEDVTEIDRSEIEASRISLDEEATGLSFEDGTLIIDDNYDGDTALLNVQQPNNSVNYSHYVASNNGKIKLENGVAQVPVSLGLADQEILVEWYTDEEQAVTFEKINLHLEGGHDSIYSEGGDFAKISTTASVFLPGYELSINDITNDVEDSLTSQLKENETLERLFDINILDSLGKKVIFEQGDLTYTVRLELAQDLDANSQYKVVYVNDEGLIEEEFTASLLADNGVNYLEFTTTHFSNYGIVKIANEEEVTEEPVVNVENPSTGDRMEIFGAILPLASVILLGARIYAKKA